MHFGENQLSPRSISISPLSTGHPPVLQHWWVRASTDCHIRFTLPMGNSRGFGSHPRHCPSLAGRPRPLQTRFPCGSPALALVNRATKMHSPDHSTKGTPSVLTPLWESDLWLLVSPWFQGLFHPPCGVLFT